MTGPAPPRLTGGGGIVITRRLQTMVSCPSCRRPLDITDVKVGATIECTECDNVTWAPEYVPRWWHRARNFVRSLVLALAIGVAGSLLASFLWDQFHQPSTQDPTTEEIGEKQ